MKISNLSSLQLLLKNEIQDLYPTLTKPLKVIVSEKDSVIVQSTMDSDLSMKLRGVKGVDVGDEVIVNIETGEVKVLEGTAVKTPAAPKRESGRLGCSNRSSIVR